MKTKYILQDREAGNLIDDFNTLMEAEKALNDYETQDKRNGEYTPDFYEIKEVQTPTEREITGSVEGGEDIIDSVEWLKAENLRLYQLSTSEMRKNVQLKADNEYLLDALKMFANPRNEADSWVQQKAKAFINTIEGNK